jgi:hypothetical protein
MGEYRTDAIGTTDVASLVGMSFITRFFPDEYSAGKLSGQVVPRELAMRIGETFGMGGEEFLTFVDDYRHSFSPEP